MAPHRTRTRILAVAGAAALTVGLSGALVAGPAFASTPSLATGTVHGYTPDIIGSGVAGTKLTVKTGTWTKGAKLTYAWYVGTVKVSKHSAYTPSSKYIGKEVTVRVTGTKKHDKTLHETSAGVAVKAAPFGAHASAGIVVYKSGHSVTLEAVKHGFPANTHFSYSWNHGGGSGSALTVKPGKSETFVLTITASAPGRLAETFKAGYSFNYVAPSTSGASN